MLKYSEELAKSGFYVTRYEDRFFWDTPENLAVYPYGTSDGGENMRKTRCWAENMERVSIYRFFTRTEFTGCGFPGARTSALAIRKVKTG